MLTKTQRTMLLLGIVAVVALLAWQQRARAEFIRNAVTSIFGGAKPTTGFGSDAREWKRIVSGELVPGDIERLKKAAEQRGIAPPGLFG